MSSAGNWPVIVVEGILVAGGALAFAWWQLRDLKKERQKKEQQAQAKAQQVEQSAAQPAAKAADSSSTAPPR
jgi:Tfp pilus assembly protein PilV